MRKSIIFAFAPFALVMLARTASAGCLEDADCKGNRVCSSGKCVSPQTNANEETEAPVQRRTTTAKSVASPGAWYGWQVLVCDGLAFAVGLAGAGMFVAGHDGGDERSRAPVSVSSSATGLAAYAFASPIVHWIHGNLFGGIGSVAGRLAMIGIGVGLTFATVDEYGSPVCHVRCSTSFNAEAVCCSTFEIVSRRICSSRVKAPMRARTARRDSATA